MPERRTGRRRFVKRSCGCCACFLIVVPTISIAILYSLLQRVPSSYPIVERPIPPRDSRHKIGGGLDGFDSPYIGHTGSWDGKGGGMGGSAKLADMDVERAMDLRWTFMPVYWRQMEPKGPVDLAQDVPPAWKELDDFVIAAHERGLNILMQAPVVGGNAGGPPDWAGRRQQGRSAPKNMEALADFASKLAQRYSPGGTLARRERWGDRYGVRAWELDNEPANYFTSWAGQAGDYAEFVTKASRRIHKEDPQAIVTTPALACGSGDYGWLEETLASARLAGSPEYKRQGVRFSIGPSTDAVSFHIYEGLDTGISGKDRTIERAFMEVRDIFERHEDKMSGHAYSRKQEYWHTEGNYDFIGVMSEERRAAWRFQFMTRAFAAGIRKVAIMDASPKERIAVRAYVQALPDPFPMFPAVSKLRVTLGKVAAFRHQNNSGIKGNDVWIVWAMAGTGPAEVEIRVKNSRVETVSVDGKHETVMAVNSKVKVQLRSDQKMPPPLIILDRPAVK